MAARIEAVAQQAAIVKAGQVSTMPPVIAEPRAILVPIGQPGEPNVSVVGCAAKAVRAGYGPSAAQEPGQGW
jgi:hypothetical protein